MLKPLLAGAVALGLMIGAAPQRAAADGDDILRGVLIGALAGGAIAAIANADREKRHYSPPPRRVYHYDRGYHRGYDRRRPVVVEKYVYRDRGHRGYRHRYDRRDYRVRYYD